MKKLIISLLGLFAIINLNAQEPQIKFYLNDGTERTYNISDVEEMSFRKTDVFSYMSIYFTDSTKSNFDTKSIEKMEISEENELLSIYTCGYPYSYEISTIDSIIFGYDTDNLYETITIGEQIWMQYNLDVCHYRNGDPIIHAQTYLEWGEAYIIGAWCFYDNDPENGKIYGKMYNWNAVNDPRGLLPEGWRVPSHEDWQELEKALGMSQEEANRMDWRGTNEGAKIAGGYDLWQDGRLRNNNEFNSSGFNGLPSGERTISSGFQAIGRFTAWWTSSVFDAENHIAMVRTLFYSTPAVGFRAQPMAKGFPVRLVKDK